MKQNEKSLEKMNNMLIERKTPKPFKVSKRRTVRLASTTSDETTEPGELEEQPVNGKT